MSISSYLTKKYASWKLKDAPAAQREMLMGLLDKDPELLKQIGEEIEKRKKGGESETKAAMEVFKKHRVRLAELLQQR